MSVYTVPALNAVDFALTVHTVPSIASPANVLQAYTVPALNAVDFALALTIPPTYADLGWDLLPDTSGTISATAAQTLGAFTQVATDTLALKASAGGTLGAVTQAASAPLAIQAQASQTLGPVIVSAVEHLIIAATAPITISGFTLSAQARQETTEISGNAAQTLGTFTQSATGTVRDRPVPKKSRPAYGAVKRGAWKYGR